MYDTEAIMYELTSQINKEFDEYDIKEAFSPIEHEDIFVTDLETGYRVEAEIYKDGILKETLRVYVLIDSVDEGLGAYTHIIEDITQLEIIPDIEREEI